jgi:hypothetical protein
LSIAYSLSLFLPVLQEAKRITDAGGFIGRNKRVNGPFARELEVLPSEASRTSSSYFAHGWLLRCAGVLAISRALGDHMLKENDVVTGAYGIADCSLPSAQSWLTTPC